MELNISRSELKTAITGLSRIIPGKTSLPILGGVKFTTDENGTVTCTATDLDQTATYRFLNSTGIEVGTLVLPLPALKELTKGADREHVQFRVEGQQVAVTNHVGGHEVRYDVSALDPQDWPEDLAPVPCKPAEGFLDVYRRLLPFASSDESRYAIQHIYVDVDGKGDRPVAMVAVDGRRLSVWNSMQFDLKSSILVPASRFLAWTGLTGKVEIGVREEGTPKRKTPESRKAWFGLKAGPWCYITRVPDVTFPNWRQVVPDYEAEPAKVQRCCFTDKDTEALRKILPTFPGHDGYNAAIVLVGSPDGRLLISGRGKDTKTDTVLSLTGGSRYEGKGGQVGINREYLLDALAAGFRTFSYVDEMSPLFSKDERGGTHVVMPVRVDHETTEAVPAVPEVNETVPAAVAGETKKEIVMPEKTEEGALDKVLLALETARSKLRDAVSSLAEVTDAVKVAVREGKTQAGDLEKARATLQKLQAISL